MRSFLPIVSLFSSSALLLGLCLFTPCSLADVYRYTDANGTIVLSRQGVPPEYVDGGYQVLNEQGRVIKVVPKAPSAEERKQIQAKQQAEQAQRKKDEKLLRLYTHPDDVERAKQGRLHEFDVLISQVEEQLDPLKKKLGVLYEKLAGTRRNGEALDNEALIQQINQLKAEQQRIQMLIIKHEASRREAEEDFNAERARLAELLEQRS